MNKPMVSVIMPVYNGEKYLKEAIDSILNQSYVDFEFIIINDGSTDKTEKIILSYNDKRIIYISNDQNLRISKSLNRGIQLAGGKYIARMDADDICLPNRFEAQINFMQENPEVDLCATWSQIFGNDGDISFTKTPILNDEIKVGLLFYPSMSHGSVMGKRNFFVNLKYRNEYDAAEDYDLWVCGARQYRYANIPLFLYKYRRHSNQTNIDKQLRAAYQVRGNYLKMVCPNLTNKEEQQLTNIVLGVFVGRNILAKLIKKIIMGNEKTNILNNNILKEQLEVYCWRSINADRNYIKNVVRGILIFILGKGSIAYLKRIFKRKGDNG